MDRLQDVYREAKVLWQGRSWRMVRPSIGSELAMKDYLEERAREAFGSERRRLKMHPEEYRTHISVWQQDCTAGTYAYGNAAFDRSLRDPENMQHWLFLILTQIPEQQPNTKGGLQREQMRQMWAETAAEGIAGLQLIEAYNLVMAPTPPTPPLGQAGADPSVPPTSSASSAESPSPATP